VLVILWAGRRQWLPSRLSQFWNSASDAQILQATCGLWGMDTSVWRLPCMVSPSRLWFPLVFLIFGLMNFCLFQRFVMDLLILLF